MPVVTKFVSGSWQQNGYLVCEGTDAVVVDPGGAVEELQAAIRQQHATVHAVLNTHAHYDHLGAAAFVVSEYDAPFFLHAGDHDLLPRANFYRTLFLGDEPIDLPTDVVDLTDTRLAFGTLAVDVLHTPGHTPGSVCFSVGDCLFTGDTLMKGAIGRTDLPGGDLVVLRSSVRRIADRFPRSTIVHPGHGDSTSLGEMLDDILATPRLLG